MLFRAVLSSTTTRLGVSSVQKQVGVGAPVPITAAHPYSSTRNQFSTTKSSSTTTTETIRNLFSTWNAALATGDPDTVTALYTNDAVLLPTVSDTPRTTPPAIRDYFVIFLQNEPRGTILDGHVQVLCDTVAQDVGIYEFTMMGAVDPPNSTMRARYSFVYRRDNDQGGWKICHHHSSILPEAALAALQAQQT